jgi:glycosyltransferase involved in cell wall biosynthesis
MEPEISVVLPVYKNRAALAELHRQLTVVLAQQGAPYELIFVDDVCPEGSGAALHEIAAADARVRVLTLPRNVGQNRAVMAGLALARGRVVVTMDADLQDPPAAIPRLLSALAAGPAAVFAGRRGAYESWGRRATSRLFKGLLHLLSQRRLPVDAGLFVALRRELVEQLLASSDPDPYVVGLIARSGLPLASVPVHRAPSSRSAYTLGMRLRVAGRALVAMLRERRCGGR